ncbi:MAG: lipoprotein [Christensenellaceae bacterium]
MKRLISIVLCILSILSLSACGSDRRIALTKDNYSEYININVYISDYSFVISKQDELTTSYDISVVVHIETSKKIDCEFESVSIKYSPINTAFWQYTYTSLPKTTINLEGDSHISYVATRTNSYSIDISTSFLTSTNNIIQSIEGFVVVPKEK